MQEEHIIKGIRDGEINYVELPHDISHKRSIVITAIQKDIQNFNWIPIKFYYDFEIMLTAVKIDGMLLAKASENLMRNYYLVLAAVTQNGKALKYVHKYEVEYQTDEDYSTYHGGYLYIRYISDDSKINFINKESIVLAAVKNYGNALKYASPRLQANIKIVTEAINQDGTALKWVSLNLQRNEDLIKKAVRNNFDAIFQVIPSSLFNTFYRYKNMFIIKDKMDYLFENIKNGTLEQNYAFLWLKGIPKYCHSELISWIHTNIYDYKNLFDIVFYKQLKFDHLKRIGYLNGIPQIILSFLVPNENIRHKQKIILKDIFNELEYYS